MRRWAGVLFPGRGDDRVIGSSRRGVLGGRQGSVRAARRYDEAYGPAVLSWDRPCRERHRCVWPGYGHCSRNCGLHRQHPRQDFVRPGSDVAESKIKPEIFAANGPVDQLIAAVQAATAQLVPAVKTGDKEAISAAYTAVYNACNACHTQFRQEE
jgi:Cytochrome C'